jgi:hypothetical protein
LFILGSMGSQRADMAAAGSDPFLFGLTRRGIDLVLAGKRRCGVPVVGGMDKEDGTRSDLPNRSQWTRVC